jgi:hypothetical protein
MLLGVPGGLFVRQTRFFLPASAGDQRLAGVGSNLDGDGARRELPSWLMAPDNIFSSHATTT